MLKFPSTSLSSGIESPNALEQAKTCNEVAQLLFPEAKGPAFLESESTNLSAPPSLQLLDLNDDFWAATLPYTVFVQEEGQFRQYQQSGLYEQITESALANQVIANLNLAAPHFPRCLKIDSFLNLKNRQRIKAVVERAKDLLAVDQSVFLSPTHLSLRNGIFNLGNNTFAPHSPQTPAKERMDVQYDPNAEPKMFLKAFLHHILEPEDIDLLQRYCSQILQGINYSQKILVLTGDAGWGKSSLMKILCSLIGWGRIGILRDQLFRDALELCHYNRKHLLYHPDMPTEFLNDAKAGIVKQLVGQDPLWAEKKDGERMVLEGHFPVILACNGKPKIKIDEDTDAWARRLVMLNFKKPTHEKHLGKLAELIATERSGILNWLLEGRMKLLKDGLQLTLTPQQKARTNLLLLASDSPSAFVRSCLIKKKDAVLGVVELYEKYQEWCKGHQLAPFSSKEFSKTAKTEIEISFGLKCRHDLAIEDGGVMRGWKGLGLIAGQKTGQF